MEGGGGGGDDEHYGGKEGEAEEEEEERGEGSREGRKGGPSVRRRSGCWREINRSKNSF